MHLLYKRSTPSKAQNSKLRVSQTTCVGGQRNPHSDSHHGILNAIPSHSGQASILIPKRAAQPTEAEPPPPSPQTEAERRAPSRRTRSGKVPAASRTASQTSSERIPLRRCKLDLFWLRAQPRMLMRRVDYADDDPLPCEHKEQKSRFLAARRLVGWLWLDGAGPLLLNLARRAAVCDSGLGVHELGLMSAMAARMVLAMRLFVGVFGVTWLLFTAAGHVRVSRLIQIVHE
ncbi:hypothetical protein TARUN_2031 [Trichoderma arundinaceum]|uniref:Uncharacterized protein n=1 Tax=Trichoderma arundinaceum TaxID=490622 RepID=A0A395NXJ8_TRIAR|nr:hypothetical protein TARUN_2031 [Trichoderma arundinaceum]